MSHAEIVVFRLAAFREAGQSAVLAHRVHAVFTAGQDFVRIALMADIPHQMVFRRVVDIMQGDGEFDRTQVAGEMAAGGRYRFEQEGAQFGTQLRQFGLIQQAQVLRQVDGI